MLAFHLLVLQLLFFALVALVVRASDDAPEAHCDAAVSGADAHETYVFYAMCYFACALLTLAATTLELRRLRLLNVNGDVLILLIAAILWPVMVPVYVLDGCVNGWKRIKADDD